MAATEAVKERLWLKGLLSELMGREADIVIKCDNQPALHLIMNPMNHERSKYIDIKLHFIRDVVASGKVMVAKVAIAENPAYALTKVLRKEKF